jgi:dephospho-CoA kinase
MLESKQVAVTGGISCGKSQFCLYLKELGAYVVSADKIVHQLLSHESDLGKKVTQLLGPDIIKGGKLDRSAIAKKVFRDAKLLKNLEQITHPQVFLEIEKRYKECCDKGKHPLFIAEIPLLFEVGAEHRFDTTITVLADESTCMNRFTKTTGLNEQEYHLRMARQLPSKEKAARADIVVCNDGSLEGLKAEAKKIFKQLRTI